MSWDQHRSNPLWSMLVDTVHTIPVYPHHKAYVRDVVLVEQPKISADELASKLGISLGESLVILYELEEAKNADKDSTRQSEQTRL
jgi:transcription initiation factor IIE alpha subunit